MTKKNDLALYFSTVAKVQLTNIKFKLIKILHSITFSIP